MGRAWHVQTCSTFLNLFVVFMFFFFKYMGVSENSVPLNPMVNDHYPYQMALIGNIPYFQTNPYMLSHLSHLSLSDEVDIFQRQECNAWNCRLPRPWFGVASAFHRLWEWPKFLGHVSPRSKV